MKFLSLSIILIVCSVVNISEAIIKSCSQAICHNDGKCLEVDISKVAEKRFCFCKSGYYGHNCENEYQPSRPQTMANLPSNREGFHNEEQDSVTPVVEPCGEYSPITCEHGGQCIEITIGTLHTVTCVCPATYSGLYCQHAGQVIRSQILPEQPISIAADAQFVYFTTINNKILAYRRNISNDMSTFGDLMYSHQFIIPSICSLPLGMVAHPITGTVVTLDSFNKALFVIDGSQAPTEYVKLLPLTNLAGSILNLAMDTQGNLYLPVNGVGVAAFDGDGKFLGYPMDIAGFPFGNGFAIGYDDHMYISESDKFVVFKLNINGSSITARLTRPVPVPNYTITGIAADPGSGDVILFSSNCGGNGQICTMPVYNKYGALKRTLSNELWESTSIISAMVDPFTSLLYVVRPNQEVNAVLIPEGDEPMSTTPMTQPTASSMKTTMPPTTNYCKNGATCVNDNGGYCNCPIGCLQPTCEQCNQFNICDITLCADGSTCIPQNSTYAKCTCPPGKTGQYCFQDI